MQRTKDGKEISLAGVNELVSKQYYQNIANQAHGILGVNAAIKEYNTLTDIASKTKLAETINSTNASLGKYLTGLNGANAGLIGYTGSLVKATAKTVALEAANMALNAAISMGVSFAIQAAIQGITYLIQKQEKLRQSTEEAANAYQETASSIDDYVSKYQELREALIAAKGNEEETYNVKKQLLDLQIELNDEFGEEYGILDLVTDAYKDQTDAIKAFNKEKAKEFLNENREGIEDAEKEMTKERHYNLSYSGMIATSDEGIALKEVAEKYEAQGISILDESSDQLQFSIHLNADAQSAYQTINDFENDLKEKAKELGDEHMFDDVLDVSSGSLNKAKDVIDKYGEIYNKALVAEIAADDDKAKTYDDVAEAVKAYNEAVLNSENPYEDENVAKAKSNLDTIKTSIQENEEEWGKYSSLFDDVFNQADTRMYDFNEALKTNDGMKSLADDLDGLSDLDLQALDDIPGENESFDKLKEFAKEYEISVEELIDALVRLGYVQGEIQSSAEDTSSDIKQSIADTWNSLIDTDEEELKNTREDLLKLAEAGQLTEETFHDTAGADTYLDSIVESLPEAIEWINQLVSSSTQLESMSAQISKMSDMLADKKNGTTASASDLAGFDATVKGLESWEEFERLLGDSESSMEDCQEAANNLATEWINNGNFLSNLTEENKRFYITQLQNMGIENAEAIVTETLTAKKIAEKYAIYDLTNATEEEISVKYQEIAALIEEGKVSETTASALFDLIYQQTIFSNQNLDVYGKISALQELALAFGITADAALGASEAINLENQLRLVKHYGGTDAQVDAYAVQLTSKTQDAIKAQFGGISASVSPSGSSGYKTPSSGGSNSPEKNETKELFDWIEKRIDKLKRRYDKWLNQAERAISTTRISAYYKFAEKNLEKLLNTEAKAYKYYQKKANAVGLSEEYASKVRSGTLNVETITDEKLIDKINAYQEWYDKMSKMSESFIADVEALYNIPIDKAAEKVEKFSDAIDLLDKKIDNAIGYKSKNTLLNKEAKNQKHIYNSYVSAQKSTQKNLDDTSTTLLLSKTLKKSGLTAKEKAAVKKAVKKGNEVDLSDFTVGTDAYIAAEKYNEALRANLQATNDLKNATEDYETVLREISKAKFDNVAKQFENVIGHIDNALDDLSNNISDIENRGMLADASFYAAQIDIHNKILAKLETEHTKLKKQLENIQAQTAEWYDALEAIQDVENSIAETNSSIKEMRDAITAIASTLNDNIVSSFHTINDEAGLLLTLLGDSLVDSEIGGFTDEGLAALGLYNSQLKVSKATAEGLLAEINSIQDAISNGTYEDFIDANGFAMQFSSIYEAELYIEELYAKYRDEISSTYSYESNIVDLMKDKYAAEIDYIKELIDQKKELLDAEKDLYEYSKDIKKQTDNIDSLRKQIAALSGDTSNETSVRIQKLQSQLKDAQEELNDSEYERYISDQQDMLDNLYAEYEELITGLEKDRDALLQEGLQLIVSNGADIQEVIRSTASDNGYQITSAMDQTIGVISSDFSDVKNLLSQIVEHMKGQYEDISGGSTINTTTSTNTASDSSALDNNVLEILSNGKSINDDSELTKAIESAYGTGINRHQMVELSKLLGLNYTLADFTGDSAEKAKEALLNALIKKGYLTKVAKSFDSNSNLGTKGFGSNTVRTLHGYSKGGVVPLDGLDDAIRLNDDTVLVSAKPGERMLTEQQNEYWEKWTNTLPDLVSLADFVKPVTNVSFPDVTPIQNRNVGTNVNIGDVNFTFPNVMNYNDFCREAQKDPRFEEMIQCMAGSGLSPNISKFKKRSIRF